MGSLTRRMRTNHFDTVINQAVRSQLNEVEVGNRATAQRVFARVQKRAKGNGQKHEPHLVEFKVKYRDENNELVTYDPKKKSGVAENRASRLR